MRGRCRACLRPSALTRRGRVWHHLAPSWWADRSRPRCRGAGHPPFGEPGPDLDPDPVRLAAALAPEHPDGTIYLLCLDEPFGHARHYLGWASAGRLHWRLAHHGTETGANLLRHVAAAGIGWKLVRTWPGDRYLERRLKNRGGHARLCPSCRPELSATLLRDSGASDLDSRGSVCA